MEWLVLLGLGAAGIGTLSSALRSQRRATPRSSVASFRRSMRVLARNASTRGASGGRCVLVLDDPARVAATARAAASAGGRSTAGSRSTAGGRSRDQPPRRRPPGAAGPPPHAPRRRAERATSAPSARRSRPATGGRARMTPAARRRLAVLRGLVGAVAASVVGWVVLDGWGLVLLAASLLALAVYCALLASMGQQRGRHERRAPAGRGEAAADADPVARSA